MRDKQRRLRGLVAGGIGVIVAILGIWFLTPGKWWTEIVVVGMVWWSVFLVTAWISRSKIWGIKISGWIIVLLILRRMGILDPILFGGWLGILGLICLFN